MNAKVRAKATKASRILGVVGVAAALMLGTGAALAESHGGGGGHFSGGGHASGGGGHFSGGGHVSAPHFAAGGHYSAAPHNFGPGIHAQVRAGAAYGYGRAYGGYGLHSSFGYGSHPGWAGGYWHGGFWPRAYYGWSYPLYLGFLPAVYATYWWGGVPYYYVNDVYYNWNPTDNNYVAVDPPPASAAGYSDDVNAAAAAGPDGGGTVDNTPQDVAPAAAGSGIIAYPRNGQSDQQQATDKFQCHTWAKGQTGFDPTNQSSSGASAGARGNYGRAMAACLDARGYTVR